LWGEKKSLVLFLTTYLISMVFFIAIFDYLYFKNIMFEILQNQKALIKQQLLNENLRFRFWNNEFKDLNITIYDGKIVLKKSPQVGVCVDYELIRGWRKFKIIACKVFEDRKKEIIFKLLFYNVVFLVFVSIFAYFLAKLFLKPMRDEIKKLENFLRDITHEMQTPIAIINSNIEMLEIKGIEYKEFQRIKNAANRLSAIFEMLKFLNLKRKEVISLNLKEVLLERIRFFETQIEQRNLKIKKELKDVILNIDKEDLIRIFDNLLSNAIKYSMGDIYIYLNEKGFCVENKGEIKNPKEVIQKFVRENKSEGGFGLGLYIVNEICKFYGFKFEITNKNGFVKVCVYF